MKLLALLGSPKKNGNTASLLNEYLKGIVESNKHVEIIKVHLQEKNIHNCSACNACHDPAIGRCIINDDMQELYTEIKESSMLVYATPVYWWGISAQLKSFIDRTFAFDDEKDFEGKKLSLLMTHGIELPNKGPEIIKTEFEEICKYTKMDLVDVHSVCANSKMPLTENPIALKLVYEMGKKILL